MKLKVCTKSISAPREAEESEKLLHSEVRSKLAFIDETLKGLSTTEVPTEVREIEVEQPGPDMDKSQDYQGDDDYQIQLPDKGASRVNSIRGIQQLAAAPDRRKESYSEEKNAAVASKNSSKLGNGRSGSVSPAFIEDDITEGHTDVDDVELQPLDILLQFIPYYGQGDPSNDAIVRSTLSGMSVEDIDSKDEYGNTLLLLACQYRCEDLARIMLNKGANPSALNSAGACCLHFACYKESQSISIAKVLLQSGANPEVVESTYGCTPLHYCAGSGNIDLCKMLLSHGAQISSADFYSYTCVDYAREARMQDAVVFLQQRLDQVNMQNSYRMMGSYGGMGMGGMGGYGGVQNGYGGFMQQQQQFPPFNFVDWREETDPASGERYYSNFRTGESLWEQDFKAKVASSQNSMGPGSGMNMGNMGGNMGNMGTMGNMGGMGGGGMGGGMGPGSPEMGSAMGSQMGSPNPLNRGGMGGGRGGGLGGEGPGGGPGGMPRILRKASTLSANPFVQPEKALETEAYKMRILTLISTHANKRLLEVDHLMTQYHGRESELLKDLCKQYNLQYDQEMSTYNTTVKELQAEYNGRRNSLKLNTTMGTGSPAFPLVAAPRVPPSPSVGGNSMQNILSAATSSVDQAAVQQMISEARATHEVQMLAMMNENRYSSRNNKENIGHC